MKFRTGDIIRTSEQTYIVTKVEKIDESSAIYLITRASGYGYAVSKKDGSMSFFCDLSDKHTVSLVYASRKLDSEAKLIEI